jgi:alcohol dehydrogenase
MANYQAIRVQKNESGEFSSKLETLPLSGLPAGELLVRVQYSSLNYKDAMSASGNPGVTRNFPHTPGIDAAGLVESSDSEDFAA